MSNNVFIQSEIQPFSFVKWKQQSACSLHITFCQTGVCSTYRNSRTKHSAEVGSTYCNSRTEHSAEPYPRYYPQKTADYLYNMRFCACGVIIGYLCWKSLLVPTAIQSWHFRAMHLFLDCPKEKAAVGAYLFVGNHLHCPRLQHSVRQLLRTSIDHASLNI